MYVGEGGGEEATALLLTPGDQEVLVGAAGSVYEGDLLVRLAVMGSFDTTFYKQYCVLGRQELLLYSSKAASDADGSPDFRYVLDRRHMVSDISERDHSSNPRRPIILSSFTLFEDSIITKATRRLGANGLKLIEFALPKEDREGLVRLQEAIERVAGERKASGLAWLMPTWMPPTCT